MLLINNCSVCLLNPRNLIVDAILLSFLDKINLTPNNLVELPPLPLFIVNFFFLLCIIISMILGHYKINRICLGNLDDACFLPRFKVLSSLLCLLPDVLHFLYTII